MPMGIPCGCAAQGEGKRKPHQLLRVKSHDSRERNTHGNGRERGERNAHFYSPVHDNLLIGMAKIYQAYVPAAFYSWIAQRSSLATARGDLATAATPWRPRGSPLVSYKEKATLNRRRMGLERVEWDLIIGLTLRGY